MYNQSNRFIATCAFTAPIFILSVIAIKQPAFTLNVISDNTTFALDEVGLFQVCTKGLLTGDKSFFCASTDDFFTQPGMQCGKMLERIRAARAFTILTILVAGVAGLIFC